METIEIDARRLLCPMPVIRLQDSLNRQPGGSRIRITCTDPGVMNDIPAWSRLHGHQVVSAIEQDAEYILVIEKTVDGA